MRTPVRDTWSRRRVEDGADLFCHAANELEIAILNLFIDIKVRYPNLIVGKLERETVKRAMDEGITAQQVSRANRAPSWAKG